MSTPEQILADIFGYQTFRHSQREIIQSVLDGIDTLVIMPTGGGKSLCYQVPALLKEGITIVVSPLIALMNDQVAALKQLGISAATVHSGVSSQDKQLINEELKAGKLKLLYVAPETLLSDRFLSFIQNQPISLIAIDEAHCVSIWGNDFRPEYVKLARLKELFPSIPTLALTATADHATQGDIIKQLHLKKSRLFVSSFERKNIHTIAQPGQQRLRQILKFIGTRPGQAGIVYCLSRKSTEMMASKLQANGLRAEAYHAGIESAKRASVQHDFQSDELDIVCATIAFGMGIDKPNIRWVIHYNMPKNIESYYQEIGRSGRDGAPAETMLFFSWADFLQLQRFITDSEAAETFKKVQEAKLLRMWEYASASSCRTNLILNYFGEFSPGPCDHCDNCLNPPEFFDGLRFAQMALSAVVRAKERLSISLLIDVLRGSFKHEIRSQGLDQLKTFGVGRDLPYLDWKHYITELINQGYLSIDFSDRSKLKTTPLSSAVLHGKTDVKLTQFIPAGQKKISKQIETELVSGPIDQGIVTRLKQWRLGLAKSEKVPAYVILYNRTIDQIASSMPKDKNELLQIDGIGKAKLERYGDEILEMIGSEQ